MSKHPYPVGTRLLIRTYREKYQQHGTMRIVDANPVDLVGIVIEAFTHKKRYAMRVELPSWDGTPATGQRSANGPDPEKRTIFIYADTPSVIVGRAPNPSSPMS